MRKINIIVSCCVFSFCAYEVIAGGTDVAHNNTVLKGDNKKKQDFKDKKNERNKEVIQDKRGASKYSGFYIGVGPLVQSINRKMDISDDWRAAAAKRGNSDQKDRHLNIFNKKQNSIGCSFVTGVGKVFNDLFYVGGEVFVDISSFKKQSQKSNFDFYKVTLGDDSSAVYSKDLKAYDTVDTKSRDINFAIVGRFGSYIEPIDSLICLRAGCSLLETSFKAKRLDRPVDCEIAPLIGIDFEKSFSPQETNNWMIRVSVDYCFPFSKKENCIRYDPMLRKDVCNTHCKAKIRGYTFRIMYLYNFGL